MHGSRSIAPLGIAIVILSASAPSLRAEPGRGVLAAGDLAAAFSLDAGRLTSLTVRGHELLTAPGEMTLQVDKAGPVSVGKGWQGFAVTERERGLVVEGREPRSGVALRAEWLAGKDLECRVTLTGGKSLRSEAAIELLLPCANRPLEVLAPGADDRHTADFSKPLGFGYRAGGLGLAMPAVTVYRPGDDWGLTACADFTLPTRGFALELRDKTPAIAVRRVHLRLEPARPVTVSMILFGHAGDWRPGLGHLVERFADFFVVADPRVPDLHGAFVCSGGTPLDPTIADWKHQHVATVEVHGTIPFYGQHLPLGKEWTAFADDQWHTLRKAADPQKPADDAPWDTIHRYVTGKNPPNVSAAKVNDYIRRLHARGIHAIMYFNPTEAWKPWITANYPDALVKSADGQLCPAWYESCLVCPDPQSAWGKHLLAEFEKMMDLYPHADGFFMDQSCYDQLDYAHDDGWSIEDGRTGYRMGWAINQVSRKCHDMAKARGKFLWWNGPYTSDIARFAEGMMAEAGDDGQVKCIQYLTMGGRACCTLSQGGEATFQNCAAYGLYPTAMPQPLARLAARYWPIFDLFRGKRWVLSAHALELPPGAKGNVWELPDGNVLASVVTAGRSIDGAAFDVNVPLTLRLPGAAGYRAAYFLSPDLAGKRRLLIERNGETLRLTLPRHRSASAVLLARTGVHLAVEGPAGAVTGRGVDVTAVVDNWTDKPVACRWTTPAWKADPLEIQAGQSARRAFRYQAPARRGGLRETATCRAEVAGAVLGGEFEFCIDEPLNVGLVLPEHGEQGRVADACVQVFNAAEGGDVRVALAGDGLQAEPAEQTVHISAGARRDLAFRIVPVRSGPIVVRATAESHSAPGDQAGTRANRAGAEGRLEVFAVKVSRTAFGHFRSGKLQFDLFGSDGGKYENKPVLLNGVRLGLLPQQPDAWGLAEMAIPREALQAIREHNEVVIENPPGDAFKIGRLRLQLRLQNGVYVLSEMNPGVFSSLPGWTWNEGKIFEKGTLRTDVHLPVDATSVGK
jgi:hypothetical protein